MTVFQRYLLIQIPGWLLVVIVVYALHIWLKLPLWAAAGIVAADIVKDFALFPLLRRAYETAEKTGAERLVGEVGVAQQEISPRGYIQVRGELWHAEALPPGTPIPEGSRVRVQAARGMTLIVTRE